MVARRVFWVLLCLIAGGPCAFIALEGVGIPTVAFVVFALVFISRRHRLLAEALVAFGLTYTVEIVRFAVPDLLSSLGQGDYWTALYFLGHLVVAVAILGTGLWIRLTAAPQSVPASRRE